MRWLVVSGALVLVLLGRGWGWWPGAADSPGASGPRPGGVAPGTSATEVRPGSAGPAAATQAAALGQMAAPAVGSQSAVADGEVGSSAAGKPRPDVDDPRRARLAVIRSALAESRLGAASAAMARLLEGDASARTLPGVEELADRVQSRIDSACAKLASHLQAGQVLAARTCLVELLEPPSAATATALDRMCTEHGWPQLTGTQAREATDSEPSVPAWEGLPRGRVVRSLRNGALARSRVLAVSDAGITLRVVDRDGVTFPTVQPWTIEPESVTAAEAAELGLSALARGELAYARLWLVCGQLRTRQPVERLETLRELLS